MTQNQIAYANYLENKRHNLVYDKEIQRHNKVSETQGWADVQSRQLQAQASLISAQASQAHAQAAMSQAATAQYAANSQAAYNLTMGEVARMNAQSQRMQAETAKYRAETDAGKISLNIGKYGGSVSLTGLYNGIVKPIGEGIAGAWYNLTH